MIRLGMMMLAAALLAPSAFAQAGSGAPDVAPTPGLAVRASPQLEPFWLGKDDYAPAAIRAEQQGRVGVLLDIGADGRVSACTLLSSSGTALLDRSSCSLLRRRGRFTPARDGRGNPAPDRWNYSIDWKLTDDMMPVAERSTRTTSCMCVMVVEHLPAPKPRAYPDRWLPASDVPPALLATGGSAVVEARISRAGRISRCQVSESSGLPAWDREICNILRRRARFDPGVNAKGRPVPSDWRHYFYWAPATAR